MSHIPRSRDQSHALCWVDCLRVRHTMCVYTHSWCDPQWLPHISGSLPASPQHNMCWKGHTQSHAGYIVPLRRCRSVHGMCSMSCSLLTCRCSFQIMGHTARPESVLPRCLSCFVQGIQAPMVTLLRVLGIQLLIYFAGLGSLTFPVSNSDTSGAGTMAFGAWCATDRMLVCCA